MTREEITKYLTELNDELCSAKIKGEITIYGGAVMCLVYDARPATKDVDAIFKPASEIRVLIQRIAERNGLPPDWLNDGLKGFLVSHPRKIFLILFEGLRARTRLHACDEGNIGSGRYVRPNRCQNFDRRTEPQRCS